MTVAVHRVVVRGHFDALTAEQRAALLDEAADHEIFKATYTEWGSFTYEPNLVAFSFRYEVRTVSDGEPGTAATEATDATDPMDPAGIGLTRARTALAEWGLGQKHLRATATDMAAMWDA